ncbi:MAG: serine hydrolase [Ahniella sp.]|nr:serine hydrolase [Ahniella sp.]
MRSLRRVFVVSDNTAANRLYEFLGQDLIHDRLGALGFPHARLVSRIGSSDVAANRRSTAVRVVDAEGGQRFARPAIESSVVRSFPYGEARAGLGWLDGDRVIAGAHDFSASNFLALGDMHTMLLALITPEAVPESQRWRISESARLSVLTEMAHWPRESIDPSYAESDFPDRYAKFLLPQGDANRWLRLYGKCGQAFGYLNDTQCVLDTRTGRQVLISASIHVNADGIFNDDVYEYDDVGLPMLAALGQAALDSA